MGKETWKFFNQNLKKKRRVWISDVDVLEFETECSVYLGQVIVGDFVRFL